VLSLYYFAHKPVSGSHLAAMSRLAWVIIALIGTLSLGFGLGGIWKKPLRQLPARERIVIRIGSGLGLLSLMVLGLGAVGAYRLPFAPIALILSLPFGLPGLWKGLKQLRFDPIRSRMDRLFAAIAGIVLALSFLRALEPPTAWDSLVYHLTGPQLYLSWGGLHHAVDIAYLGFPQGGGMLFLWALMLSAPALAQLLHLAFAMMTVILVYSIACKIAPKAAWLSVAIMVSVPSAALLASWAYVEWMTMFAAVAAFRLILSLRIQRSGDELDRPTWTLSALAGFLLGFGLATKYSAVGLAAGLVLVLVLEARSLRLIAVAMATGLGTIGPFLLKNLLLTGNPFYPFFLPGTFWDDYRAAWYSRPATGLSLPQVLSAPWDATVWGIEGAAIVGMPSYGADIGPLLLVLIPLLGIVLIEKKDSSWPLLRIVGLACAVAYLSWLGMLAYSGLLVQTRLLFPALPFLVLLAAAGLESVRSLGRRGSSAHFILRGLIAFVISITAVGSLLEQVARPSLPVILGAVTEEQYLESRLGEYAVMMKELDRLPANARVRFLWEPRSYRCPSTIRCDPDALLDRWWHARRTLGSVENIADAWRAEGITHVLLSHFGRNQVEHEGFDAFTAEDWSALDMLIQHELISITASGSGYSLYRLRTLGA
jgi:hypothetical protein